MSTTSIDTQPNATATSLEQLRAKAATVLGEKAAELGQEDFERVFGRAERAVPQDFDDYDYDMMAQQAATDAELAPLRAAATQRLGLSWVRGAGMYANAVAFTTALSQRREARHELKLTQMSPDQRTDFLDKWGARQARRKKLGMYALAGGLTLMATKSGIEAAVSFFDADIDAASALQGGSRSPKSEQHAVALVDNPKPLELTGLDEAIMRQYNNTDASFYDYNNKTFRGDFGPALQASEKDGTMPAGFGDWMSRNKHEPNGLANLVAGLGLGGEGDSMADRNALADLYDNDKKAHIMADIMVQNELRNPEHFAIKIVDLGSYDTTYMVDNNGDPVIAGKQGLNLGGTAYEITDKKTGKISYFRIQCGGYQQVWPIEEAPVQKQIPVSYGEKPQGGSQPAPAPEKPHVPVVPERPDRPTPTPTPEPTPTPTPAPTPTPNPEPEHKGEAYRDNEKLTTGLGSGQRRDPDPVEVDRTEITGRDIGGGQTEQAHTDRVTNERGSRQSGAAQNDKITHDSQDTSSNSDSGKGVGRGDTSGGTTSSDNGANR